MRYSEDLRRRVVKYVREGGTKAEGSRRYGVSVWCVYDWLRRGDELAPGKLAGPRGSYKMDWGRLREVLGTGRTPRLRSFGQGS